MFAVQRMNPRPSRPRIHVGHHSHSRAPNIAFNPINYEREPIQMVRCITADILNDKYNITAVPGDVYDLTNLTTNWRLMVLLSVCTQVLITCREGLRTMTTSTSITCFHIIDLYRGNIKFEWWLDLIITVLSNFSGIRFLDEWTHSFPKPVSIQSALSALDVWSRANADNQSLPRSVWQDFGAIKGCFPNSYEDPLVDDPGRQILYSGALRPQLVDYVQYATNSHRFMLSRES